MLGVKFFQSAKNLLAGIELMHMIRKGQLKMEGVDAMSFAGPVLCPGRKNPSNLRDRTRLSKIRLALANRQNQNRSVV